MKGFGHVPRPRDFTAAKPVRPGKSPCGAKTFAPHPLMLRIRGFKSRLHHSKKPDSINPVRLFTWLGLVDVFQEEMSLGSLVYV